MKLMVPDISISATGEKTLRQYRCASVSRENVNMDLTIAVTNRRIIQHAENGNSGKSELIHNEIFIDNIGGFSFSRGEKNTNSNKGLTLFLLFLLFAAIGGVLFWQATPVFNFVKRSIPTVVFNDVFKFGLAGFPLVIFIIVALIINKKSHSFNFNMVIYTKGLKPFSIITASEESEDTGYIVIPYLKETKAMISEISSIVLDVQKFGSEEVLRHIDAEDSTL